jgi:hypothetical protein
VRSNQLTEKEKKTYDEINKLLYTSPEQGAQLGITNKFLSLVAANEEVASANAGIAELEAQIAEKTQERTEAKGESDHKVDLYNNSIDATEKEITDTITSYLMGATSFEDLDERK